VIPKTPLGAFLKRNPFSRGWTDGLFYREKMRAIHRIAPLELRGGARILEVGGGRSGMAAMLYDGATVITADIDPSLNDRAGFVYADARCLPFDAGTFDIVTMFDVLEHIEDDGQAAAEARRVTRAGGVVLISTPTAEWRYPHYRFMTAVCPHESELMAEWGHVRRGYRLDDLSRLFGRPPDACASFINPVTAFFHDVAFSHLNPRRRKLLYAAAAIPAALAYGLHRPATRGTENALAWRQ
jgi:SAM-dependent methyltransferase